MPSEYRRNSHVCALGKKYFASVFSDSLHECGEYEDLVFLRFVLLCSFLTAGLSVFARIVVQRF